MTRGGERRDTGAVADNTSIHLGYEYADNTSHIDHQIHLGYEYADIDNLYI